MSDVFISYARPDEPVAKRVADALTAAGYRAWRDDELPAHLVYADVIQERLTSAGAVVVLWSKHAAKSQWVRAEADAARTLGTLVQVTIDGSIPPIPFNQVQCADLNGWGGDTTTPGWRKLAASVGALAGEPQTDKGTRPSSATVSVCVLPFANMSGDAEQEYFSDGISEDITTDLSKVSALEVIARNTAFQFKGHAGDICEIAKKLGVSHVLEGSVRKAGNCVRITAQLIDGTSGGHVWAERYDRELTDIFAMQDELSEAIVKALKIKLLPEEKKAIEQRGTSSVEAYNLYLMARQCWVSGDLGNRRREEKVIRICQKATEIDPDYPHAWALMALAQANLAHGFGASPGADDGAAASQRALDLDPTIAEAHLPKAWRLAERGHVEVAKAVLATALELGPESWEVNKETARLFYRQRRIADATRYLEKAMELMEADFHGWGMLFACYIALNDGPKARHCAEIIIKNVEEALSRDPDNGTALIFGALGSAALGQRDRARAWIDRALLLDPDNMFMRYNLAMGLLTFFNEKDSAVDMLGSVLPTAGPSVVTLAASDPNLDSLRDDPRFRQLLDDAKQRCGIAQSAITTPAAASKPLRS
jgi:adenylate cyclase